MLWGFVSGLLGPIISKAMSYFTKKKEANKIEDLSQQLITQEKEKIEQDTKHEMDKKEQELKEMTDEEFKDEWKKTFRR